MAEKSFKLVFDGYWKDANISRVPEKSGIYCVYTGIFEELNKKSKLMIHKLLYIGDSDNANATIVTHEKTGEFKKYTRERQILCYSFAPLVKEDRERVKSALIITHNPPGNSDSVKKFEFEKTHITCEGQNNLLKKDINIEKS